MLVNLFITSPATQGHLKPTEPPPLAPAMVHRTEPQTSTRTSGHRQRDCLEEFDQILQRGFRQGVVSEQANPTR